MVASCKPKSRQSVFFPVAPVNVNAVARCCSTPGICNPRCGPLRCFVRPSWYYSWSWNGVSTELYSSIFRPTDFTIICHVAFALDQRFAALGVHEKRPVTFFNYLGTIYHEANINFHAICKCHAIECYAIAQINLFMVYKYFFAIDMRGLQRLCCVKLSEQFVKTWQAVDRANWVLLILNWFAIH